MTPETFIKKWHQSELKERSASQSHFNDLCALLGEPNPTDADQAGEWFCFEKGARKTGGGDGWADVWKRGHFGWEYKGPGKDLNKAYQQLQRYAVALENPPLLVVSDCRDIIIHTNFTNAVYETHTILIEDIGEPENLQKLHWLFTDPERLRPGQTRDAVTEQVAKAFACIAQRLRDDGFDPHKVAHFVNRLLFCMFAEDIELLPDRLFTRMLETCEHAPQRFAPMASELFAKMNTGGYFGADEIAWFNGGLFNDGEALPLDADGVKQTLIAARMDWSSIEPSIFGTMFERGLDPAKRSQLGAHYTDAEKIMLLIEPVILRPLRQEWEAAKSEIEVVLDKVHKTKSKGVRTSGMQKAHSLLGAYLDRLRNVRVLDPACGSGNFLYLALMHLKDLEHRVLLEAESMGLGMQLPQLGPEVVKGIEINAYAAELARVTVWIGQIQWMIGHGFSANRKPILKSLETIENRDALIEEVEPQRHEGTKESQGHSDISSSPSDRIGDPASIHGFPTEPFGNDAVVQEAEWPEAEFIVGNPPFLGDKKMIAELGEEYTKTIRKVYKGRVPGGADLVTYWFEKARYQLEQGKARQAGLVATNSIRQKRNRPVLERICKIGRIFEARSDEPWVNEGAAVRVSLICFSAEKSGGASLDGESMAIIFADLNGLRAGVEMTRSVDLTKAGPLKDNKGWSYFGLCLAGKFKVSSDTASEWLQLPNPHGKPNSDVLKPIYNGSDITQHWKGNWVIDFGPTMPEQEAALYEAPFAWVVENVKPIRINNNRKARAVNWWRHGEARPGLRAKLENLCRFIATSETAKHRFFVWFPLSVAPEHSLIVIPRDDDVTFGILSSRIHTLWALAKGGRMGKGNDPRYNSSVTFETFPFPNGFDLPLRNSASSAVKGFDFDSIAHAAKRLDELRNNWLNPLEWVERIPEVVEGFPDRIIAKLGHEAVLKKRTLTNLYNAHPAWLDNIHKELDAAVATAYGWDDYTPAMPDEEILARLFALNQERAAECL